MRPGERSLGAGCGALTPVSGVLGRGKVEEGGTAVGEEELQRRRAQEVPEFAHPRRRLLWRRSYA